MVRVVFLASLFLLLSVALMTGKIPLPRTFLDFPMFFFAGVCVLISFAALDILLSLKDAALHFFLILFFYFVVSLVSGRRLLLTVVRTYIYTATAIAVYGIYQQVGFVLGWPTALPFLEWFSYHNTAIDPTSGLWSVVFDISSFFVRIKGTFLDTNIFAGYIVSALGLTVAEFLKTEKGQTKTRLTSMAIVLVLSVALMLTMSRSGLIGLFLLLLTLLFYLRGELMTLRVAAKFISVSGLLMVVLFLSVPGLADLVGGVLASFFETSKSTDRGGSIYYHMQIYLNGIRMFLENPLTGVGLSNFRVDYAQVNPIWKTGFTNKNMMPHSAFLSYFAEGGLVGAFAHYSVIGTLIFFIHKRIKQLADSFDKYLLVGIFCSYIGILGCNIFYQFYLMEFVWFVMALNVVAYYVLKPSEPRSEAVGTR